MIYVIICETVLLTLITFTDILYLPFKYLKIILLKNKEAILYFSIILGFTVYYFKGNISAFKFLSFSCIILFFYFIDILCEIIKSKIKDKNFLSENIYNILILILCCYENYIFNEDFWLLKGILIVLIINTFQIMNIKSQKTFYLYNFIYFLVLFSMLRWTKELYYISFFAINLYYFFEYLGCNFMKNRVLNLIGYISGIIICESICYNLIYLISLIILLIIYDILHVNFNLNFNRITYNKNLSAKGIMDKKVINFIRFLILELKLR